MKHVLLFGLMLASFLSYSQYPASGVKQRLGWQTTGDGLVYRGAIADTSTLDPSGLNNAWMLLDTSSGNLYAYRIKAWRLVSGGGGGGGVSMPFDSVTFNINEGDASEQELKYSAEKGYLQYGGLDSVQIPLLPGIWYVRNDTSVTIPKGTVVRASGTLGASGRIKVKHMIANGTIPAMYVLGIAMQDIAVGADGYVMTQGKIRQVNTQAYSEGAVLYADVDTLGGLTQTEPGNGYLKLPIAFVVHSASNGTLAVRIDAGSSLHDLHDVDTAGRANGSVLRYDSALKYWKASTTAGIVASDTSVFVRQYQLSGTSGYLPKYTTDTTLGNSPILNVADNQLVVGHNAVGTGAKNVLEIRGTGNTDFDGSKVDLYVNSSGQEYHSPIMSLRRSRSATAGGFTKAEYNDWLGQLLFNGADGDEYTGGAGIRAVVDSVTGNNDMPASLYFLTTPNGSSSLTTRMAINNAGRVGIGTISPSRTLHVSATDAVRIPVGTAVQRGTGANGDVRFNSDSTVLEFYDGTGWRKPIVTNRGNGKGVANSFLKFDAAGFADTSAVLIQNGNKIGIGTASPDSTLHVFGGATITTGIRSRTLTGGTSATDSLILQGTNGNGAGVTTGIGFNVGNNGATRAMTILNNGYVGIRAIPKASLVVYDPTTNPVIWLTGGTVKHPFTPTSLPLNPVIDSNVTAIFAQRSSVTGGAQFNGLSVNGNSGTAAMDINGYLGSASPNNDAVSILLRTWKLDTLTGGRTALTGTNKVLRVAAGSTSVIEVQGNGNTGFGTTSPTAVLHLKAGTSSANTAPLKFTSGTDLTIPEAGAVEWDGSNLFVTNSSASRRTVNQGLTASTFLQFGTTAAQTSKDLNVTVTGASDGDVVSLGVPNGAVHANSCYTAWVSAANTVTIRFNNYSSASIAPGNYEFKIFVTKF